jgi:A/G-specific adenine glycosylase
VLAVLRTAGEVHETAVLPAWPDQAQRARAIASLIADGLLVRVRSGHLALP